MDVVEDKQLDALLATYESSGQDIMPILARYTTIISGSNSRFIEHYSPLIDALCEEQEKEDPSIRGIRQFNNGIIKFYRAHFEEALQPLELAIESLRDSKYQDILALAHMISGSNHRSLGEFDQAVEHLMKGLEIIDPKGIFAVYSALTFYQLAEINVLINDLETAERHYRKSIFLSESLNSEISMFRSYNGMANFYLVQNKLEDCRKFLDKSLSLPGLTESQKSRSYCDLGIYFFKSQNQEEAEKNLRTSYNWRMKAGLKDAAATSLIHLAKVYRSKGDLQQAQDCLKEAMFYSEESRSKIKIMECHFLLGEVYADQKLWKESSQSFKNHLELNKELTTRQLQNIYDLKNRQIQKQKQVIEEAHKEITDSIAYAKRIQSAILPPNRLVKTHLPNSFVLYKPKDVVAGDFYWLEISCDKVLFAVADCTGHGVPGAMVSVICNNGLNRSVRELKMTEPGQILDQTREIIIEEFGKSEEEVKDGMDIALCTLEGTKLGFSGANNPAWIFRQRDLIELQADKQPIGKFENAKAHTTTYFELKKGDTIYLFSDGYADQFGGDHGKKFMSKNLKNLLADIQHLSMEEQCAYIDTTFETWRGREAQVDDVCIMGVKI